MSDSTQTFITRIFLNDEQAQNKIETLRKKIKDLRTAQEQALKTPGKDGDKQWKEASKQIRQYEQELKKLSTTSQQINQVLNNLSGSSVKDLKATIKALNKELDSGSVERNTKEWHFLQEQLQRCKTELAGIKAESEAASKGGLLSKTADFLNKNWGAMTQFFAGFSRLNATVSQYTQAYADMEEAMANVRKYTGQTDEEIHAMNEEFKQMDTRTSRQQLNELAGAAGRLGITAHDDIMEFVDAADKINVALGDDLGEGAVDQIGKLAMAFGEDDTLGLRGAMLATGSAVNELAQNSSANAGYLVDFAARLGGVGKQAGLTQSQIMGLASVMDENMLRDEMAATALTQLITKMTTDTETFARLAGQPIEEFSRMVREDMNGALLTFFDAMKAKGGFTDIAPMFEQMGLNGQRASTVLTVFADKIADVRRNQAIANNAYLEATSVMEEYDVQNSTVQAGMDKAAKQADELRRQLGEALYPAVNSLLGVGQQLIPILSTIISFLAKHAAEVVTLAAVVASLALQQQILNTASKVGAALEAAWTAACTAKTVAVQVLAGKVSLLTVAQHGLNAAVKAFPATIFISAAALMVAGIKKLSDKYGDASWRAKELNKEIEEQNKRYDQQKDRIGKLLPIAQDASKSMEQRNTAIARLKEICPDYFKNLDTETSKLYKVAEAQQEVVKRQKEANRQKYRSTIADYNQGAAEYKEEYGQSHTSKVENRRMQPGVVDTARMVQQEDKKTLDEKRIAALAAEKALRSLMETEKEEAEVSSGRKVSKNSSYPKVPNVSSDPKDLKVSSDPKDPIDQTKKTEDEILRYRMGVMAKLKAAYYDQNSELYQNDEALAEALYRNDMDSLQDRLALQETGSDKWLELTAQMAQKQSDHELQQQADYYDRLSAFKRQWLETDETESQEKALSYLEDFHSKGLLSEEEYQQALAAIKDKYADTPDQPDGVSRAASIVEGAATDVGYADDYGTSAIANIFQIVDARTEANRQLKALYEANEITAEEYDEKRKQNNQAMFAELVAAANAAYSGLSSIMSAASSYAQACSDLEVAKIEANYDKQIAAAGNNSKKKEKLEKEKDAAVAKAKTKANKKAMKIEIAQAYASTAMAAINAYASASKINWLLGAVAAAMATAAGMLQIATIKKQHQAEQAGYYSGGFTGGRRYRREAGVVHEGEFVANHQAVNNRSILPALELIDQAQRDNTISSLTAADVSRSLGTQQQPTVVSAPAVTVNTDNGETAAALSEVSRTLGALNDRLSVPIAAHLSMDELDREQRKYKRLNS